MTVSYVRKTLLSCAIATLLFSSSFSTKAQAHGYPPFGAWAYGSAYPSYGYVRSRTVYRSRPVAWHGAYGNYGFSATTRVRYRYGYRPYVGLGYPSYRLSYSYPGYYRASYRYVAPAIRYYAPVYYSVPVYTYPIISTPIVPIYTSPAFCAAAPSSAVSTTQIGLLTKAANVQNAKAIQISQVPLNANGLPTSIARPTTKLVSTASASTARVPESLIDAADAIFKAGGFKEAARAYAELSVKFGSSAKLLERRLVSLVLNGDLAQAEIVVSLAEMQQIELRGHGLGMRGLKSFVNSAVLYEAATESLAKRAFENPKDSLALKTIATWLRMSADHERANLFFAAAEALNESAISLKEVQHTVAKPELVSIEK